MEPYATIIISYRRPDLLAGVLERVAAQVHAPQRVVVVDNAGDLDERILQGTALSNVTTIVRRPDNPGYAAAVNIVRTDPTLRDVRSILVLTHDAQFDERLAAGLDAVLDGHSDAGAAAPLLKWASDPARVFSAGGRLTRGGRAWNSTRPADAKRPYTTDWVDGAIILYRREALDAVDWLDESYFLYFEDVDTAWRMRRAGWSTFVDPTVIAYQQPGEHPMYLGIRNMTLFARKARIGRWRALLAVSRRVAEESIYRALHHRTLGVSDAWRGWRDGQRGASGRPNA